MKVKRIEKYEECDLLNYNAGNKVQKIDDLKLTIFMKSGLNYIIIKIF
jgi:hypothetical protein